MAAPLAAGSAPSLRSMRHKRRPCRLLSRSAGQGYRAAGAIDIAHTASVPPQPRPRDIERLCQPSHLPPKPALPVPRTHGPSPRPSLVPYPSSCSMCVTSTRPTAIPNPNPNQRQLRDEYHAQLFTQARHGTLTLPPAPWLYKVTLPLPLRLTPTVYTCNL